MVDRLQYWNTCSKTLYKQYAPDCLLPPRTLVTCSLLSKMNMACLVIATIIRLTPSEFVITDPQRLF